MADLHGTSEALTRLGIEHELVSDHELMLPSPAGYNVTLRFLDLEHKYVQQTVQCRACGQLVFDERHAVPRDEGAETEAVDGIMVASAGRTAYFDHLQTRRHRVTP